jgi:hypothetical protein
MPIVFVHGVATRTTGSYETEVAGRNALLQRYVAPALGWAASVPILNPYWGDDAAAFRWHHASVPTEGAESFGPEAPAADVLLSGYVDGEITDPELTLAGIARASPEDAFDLLWATALEDADDDTVAGLADLAHSASDVIARIDGERLVAGAASDEVVLDRLLAALEQETTDTGGEIEAFGANEVLDRLSESLVRLRGAAGRLAGRGATKLLRSKLHENGAMFVGDVFTYLAERGDKANPGPIVAKVIADLDRAVAAPPATKLVVIAHSMGGNIMYDVLSYFRPDLRCDLFVTVGSQVGLFEELCLLMRSREAGCPSVPKVERLANVERWINVFDYNDVLGYAAEGIFEGVEDYAYSTGKGVVQAHTTYFQLPSFYRRLASRVEGD